MGRNVEIKAKVSDLDAVRHRLDSLVAGGRTPDGLPVDGPTILQQEDTFFRCDDGRLKLRVFSEGSGELIFYRRADSAGPRESFYQISRTDDPVALLEVLRTSLGVAGAVRKWRTLYLVGQTRVHLDDVEDLGPFLELEVVMRPEQSADEGRRIAEKLMRDLGVSPDDLVKNAYIDLLPEATDGKETKSI